MFRREALCDLASTADGIGGLWIRLLRSAVWLERARVVLCYHLPGDKSTTPRPRKGIAQSLSLSHRKLSSDKVRQIKRVRVIELEYLRRKFEWMDHSRLEIWETLILRRLKDT